MLTLLFDMCLRISWEAETQTTDSCKWEWVLPYPSPILAPSSLAAELIWPESFPPTMHSKPLIVAIYASPIIYKWYCLWSVGRNLPCLMWLSHSLYKFIEGSKPRIVHEVSWLLISFRKAIVHAAFSLIDLPRARARSNTIFESPLCCIIPPLLAPASMIMLFFILIKFRIIFSVSFVSVLFVLSLDGCWSYSDPSLACMTERLTFYIKNLIIK